MKHVLGFSNAGAASRKVLAKGNLSRQFPVFTESPLAWTRCLVTVNKIMSGASNVKRCHWIPGGLASLWLMLCISAGRSVVAADFSNWIVVMISVDGLVGCYLGVQ